jgi:hypothetical protein
VVGVGGDGAECLDGVEGRGGEALVGAAGVGAGGGCEVGLDVGMLELVEELAEGETGVHRGYGQWVGGGEVCVDDVDLEGGEGWEVGELGGHEGQGRGAAGRGKGEWGQVREVAHRCDGRCKKVAE